MFKRICLLMTFVLALPLSACAAGSACEEGYQGIITFGGELHYQIHDQVDGSVLRKGSPYSGDVIPLKNGKLLLVASVWRVKDRDFGDAAYGITSDDMGKTWSKPFQLKLKGGGVIEAKHSNSVCMTLLRLKSGALGLFRVAYPTLCFLDDKAIITYGYGCKDDTVGYVACKIRVLPIEWFYK